MFELEDTFDAEIDLFRKGMPFDAGTIIDRIKIRSVAYQEKPSAETLDLLTSELERARQPLSFYIHTNEQQKANILAAYKANTDRRVEAEKDKLFWQMGCIAISAFVVIWLLFRAISWLSPAIHDLTGWGG